MLYLCITPQRYEKTERILSAMAEGWGEPVKIVEGLPPVDEHPVMLWGQRFLAEILLPHCIQMRRPFYHIDNGYWEPARGSPVGNYRVTYRSLGPVLLPDPAWRVPPRIMSRMKPWKRSGNYVLLAHPGEYYGCSIGLNMRTWSRSILGRLHRATNRPIRPRMKPKGRHRERPLDSDLAGAFALVTHSSNVAVDAVLAGVPVFVEKGSPAEPVGRLDLAIERAIRPERTKWLASLSCQQFTLDEMRDGTAYRCLQMVREQVDDMELRHVARDREGPGAFPDWGHGHEFAAGQR